MESITTEMDHMENGDLLHDSHLAIQFNSAYKSYGNRKKNVPVLMNMNMEVPCGKIYGLLGPSGCGKTTLLKCIVGKLKLDAGSVIVFDEIPGTAECGVPGSRVGYMPQELALFGEFNIKETLRYFSRIFGLSTAKYNERMSFLLKFLDLPSKTRMLQNMSGGQQRRASLAVALLHEPELLILDEPTVGVDPLLRTSIWHHLMDLSNMKGTKTTIIITTHYIEEARQAHKVGMMRFGKLLAEGSPDDLLNKYEKPNLDAVFLDLCVHDGDIDEVQTREEKNKISCKSANSDIKTAKKERLGRKWNTTTTNNNHNHIRRVNACMIKTLTRMKKRIGFLIYQFVLPALQVSLFCLAIGQDPKNLPIGIVNHENGNCYNFSVEERNQCPIDFGTFGIPVKKEDMTNFSCRYLSYLDTSIISPVYYDEVSEGIHGIENGDIWGLVYMERNFTASLYKRIFESLTNEDVRTIDRQLLNTSSIKVRMDVTNQHIAFSMQLKLIEAFKNFMTQMIDSCGMPIELADIPVVFEEPVYGSSNLTFTDFMAPGIILTIVHSMALGYSAMIIIIERNEGLLDRTWIAGVTSGEFALAHFLVSLLINLIQVVVTLVFMILIFQVPALGSLLWIFLLTMLQGICGTTIGLIISAICKTQQDATQIALGIFYPNLILSGIIWPVESMPTALKYISYSLPQTFACEAMRGILLRGWGIWQATVWRGFAMTIGWIIATYAIFKHIVKDT